MDLLPAAAAAARRRRPAAPNPQSVAVKTGVQRTVSAALHAPIMRNALVVRPASISYLRLHAAEADLLPVARRQGGGKTRNHPKSVAVKTGLQRTKTAALHAPKMAIALMVSPASMPYLWVRVRAP